jgi:two-component system chemotaxis sensor kinase CheA
MHEAEQEVIREFLIESHENLTRLETHLIALEKNPADESLLSDIFRTFHTLKGTAGFLSFPILEKVAHQAEDLLTQLRDGRFRINPELVSLILQAVDAIRQVLERVEAQGEEGSQQYSDLLNRLQAAAHPTAESEPVARPAPAPGPSECAAAAEEAVKPAGVSDSSIRVGVGLLDKLMDLVGELVLTRNQILQFNAEREDASLNATSQRLNLITTELQEGVMKTRMQPIGTVWEKLPRVVRDMAAALGKQIQLEMDGNETELDRTIIEAIKDPLVHLVRNACDHGLEHPQERLQRGKPAQGRLLLRAHHEGGQVIIEISDDGMGIDVARVRQKAVDRGLLRPEQAEALSERETLQLIFQPGFSTAQQVTNVSGRGVGMDVVKHNVERIGGTVDLSSQAGRGTSIRLKIPLTLAIIPGLVVTLETGKDEAMPFLIPQVNLVELVRLESEQERTQIHRVRDTLVYRLRGQLLPVVMLREVLGLGGSELPAVINIVVVQAEQRQFGLVVDGIKDTQEIVVKPLGKQLKGLNVYGGATIMGDGRVALILDVLGIGQRAGVLSEGRARSAAAGAQRIEGAGDTERLLLVRAGAFERLAMPLALVARLEEFPRESVERAAGQRVVQYRNRILPLIPLAEALEPGTGTEFADPVPVVVFQDGEKAAGLVVDEILDVAEERIEIRRSSERPGLLGSAVVARRVADFLDLAAILRSGQVNWFSGADAADGAGCVLVAEGSAFVRGLIRNRLAMAGYHVLEAGTVPEAIQGLERQPVSVVLAATDLPQGGAAGLAAAIQRNSMWQRIPLVALTAEASQDIQGLAGAPAAHWKYDQERMVQSVAQLAKVVAQPELSMV